VIAAIILYLYARQEIVGSFFDAHVKLRRVSDLLLPVIAAGSLVSLVAGGFLALFLPQKIAGPLFRIERGLESVKGGDLTTKIQLRTEDALQDFAGSVSGAVDSVRDRVHAAKESCRKLEAAIEKGDQELVTSLLEAHRQQLEKLQT
jgi:methyl-accepting chemotaxis protein